MTVELISNLVDNIERGMELIDEILFGLGIAAVFVSPYVIWIITLIRN